MENAPSTVVGKNIASVNDGIAHGLVGVVDADLGAETPSQTLSAPGRHLSKVLKICLDAVVAVCRGNPIATLQAHLGLLSIVGIGVTRFDELDGKIVQSLEMVRGVSDYISVDIHEMQVLENSLFELGLRGC
jgi:hypothetical protein